MKIINTELPGVLIIEPQIFNDERGFFMETYHQTRYAETVMERIFVQDNFLLSLRGTLRGLHYQLHHAQAKLVQVVKGAIYDVAVDIRRGSPAYGQWTGIHLSDQNNRQLFIPQGFAHGFCALSEEAYVFYKCTDFYTPEDEEGVLWSDPTLAIDWPVSNPLLSEKDRQYACLADIPRTRLPVYEEHQ